MKEGGLYNNMQYANRTREVENARSLEVKSPTIESPVNEVTGQNGAVNGSGEQKLPNGNSNGDKHEPASGYTNGHKRTVSGYSNGDKKKSLFRRLSLHR